MGKAYSNCLARASRTQAIADAEQGAVHGALDEVVLDVEELIRLPVRLTPADGQRLSKV